MTRSKPSDTENCCEHGDHPAPDGKRFCGLACERCEHESVSENGCDKLCKRLCPYCGWPKNDARCQAAHP